MKKIRFILFTAFLPLSALAADFPQPDKLRVGDTLSGPNDILKLLESISNWIFAILLTVAVIFILIAAFDYLTSGGGEKVQKAHKRLLYAAIAIAVAVLSKGIVAVIQILVK